MFLRRSPRRGVRIGTRSNRRRKSQPEKNKQNTRRNSLHKLPPETTVAGVYSGRASKPIPHLGDDIAMTWPCHATAAAPTGSLYPVSAPWSRCAISGADPGFEA